MSDVKNIKVNTNKTDANGFRFSSIRIFGYDKTPNSAFPTGEKSIQKTKGKFVTSREARTLGLSGTLQIQARAEQIEIVVSKIRDVDGVRIIRLFRHNSVTRQFYCYEYRSDRLIGTGATYKFVQLIGEKRVSTHAAERGYIVGTLSRENVKSEECNFANLRQWADENKAELFGYWRDENGNVSFDVVQQFSVEDSELAVQTALQCNQRAIFDCAADESVSIDSIQIGETETDGKIYRSFSHNGQTFELCSELADLQGNELTLSNVG